MKQSNSNMVLPNEITLGSIMTEKIRSGRNIHFYDDTGPTTKTECQRKITYPECLEIVAEYKHIDSNIFSVVSVIYGFLHVHSFKDNYLIDSNMCVLVSIANRLRKNKIQFQFIGDKPFLNIKL